jgi:hypothetical protein
MRRSGTARRAPLHAQRPGLTPAPSPASASAAAAPPPPPPRAAAGAAGGRAGDDINEGKVFFELKKILTARTLDKLASRALAEREEEVAQALEKGFGLAEFARTMALQIEARFPPTRAVRF